MNYHIMVQDKFIDSYIEDVYLVGEEQNNLFWIRGNKGDNKYINTERRIEYLGDDFSKIKEKLEKIKDSDTIIVHWYDDVIAELLYSLPNKLIVFFWGAEFYETPFWYNAKWVYDKKTYRLVKDKLYPKIRWTLGLGKFKRSIKSVLDVEINSRKFYKQRLKHAARIDYIVCSRLNVIEIEKLRELYPTLKAKHIFGFYNLNFDLAENKIKQFTKPDTIKILVGNSASYSNNHIEAFNNLKSLKNIEIYCVLSYGAEWYKNYIIELGNKIFGVNFFPITEYMLRSDYIDFVNEMDMIYMYHNRSQAWGNIASAITLGKPIFMKNNNPLKGYISEIGIETYNAKLINKTSIINAILHEQNNIQNNVEKLKRTISDEVRLDDLKFLLKHYADS